MSYYPSSLRLNKIQQILVIKSKKHSKDIQKNIEQVQTKITQQQL